MLYKPMEIEGVTQSIKQRGNTWKQYSNFDSSNNPYKPKEIMLMNDHHIPKKVLKSKHNFAKSRQVMLIFVLFARKEKDRYDSYETEKWHEQKS